MSRARQLATLVAIVLMLAYPVWEPVWSQALTRLLDSHAERDAIAARVEREQRAAGVPYHTATGELRRAVVVTPSRPENFDGTVSFWTWMYRVLAAILAASLVRRYVKASRSRDVRVLE